ncbi:MAG: OmpH family outer membrane protein [Chitinophagales bacterium]|nr:OmpH family outer membrane protein [Bacteroidota bacterium]
MNKILSVLGLLFCLTWLQTTHAQVKFGHINSADLLVQMNEMKAADKELETFSKQIDAQYQAKVSNFQTKYQTFAEAAQRGELSPAAQSQKEKELQDLQTEIQNFEAEAQQNISKKRDELITPILEKAQKAIKDVADENGIAYIFDLSTGTILAYPASDDVSALVKAKLGIQ